MLMNQANAREINCTQARERAFHQLESIVYVIKMLGVHTSLCMSQLGKKAKGRFISSVTSKIQFHSLRFLYTSVPLEKYT